MFKKIFLFVALVSATMSLSAQKFYEIEDGKMLTDEVGVVSAGAQELRLYRDLFDEVAKAPQHYYLVVFVGEKACAITVARKSACSYVVTEVVAVEQTGEKYVVKLANNVNYTTSNSDWATVLPGQHVAYAVIDGETKGIARRPHVVSRDVALTNAVPVSPAPSKPIIILDSENKVIGTM